MKYKINWVIVICVILFVTIFPFEKTSIPEWKVLVVDKNDNPVPNIPIRQTWSNNKEANEETLITNSEGVVIFSARKDRQPLLVKTIFTIQEKIEYLIMPHGTSRGPTSSVFPANGARSNILHYSEGEGLDKKMVLTDYP